MRKSFHFVLLLLTTAAAFAQTPSVPAAGAPHLSTIAMIDLPGRPGFDAIVFANHLIVASQTDANAIDIFDPKLRRLVAQITNVPSPGSIAVDTKNNRLFVGTANSTIDIVSCEDWQVKDSFHIDASPDVLAISADGVRLFVGDKRNNTISAVDTSLRKTIAVAELGGRPEAIVLGDAGLIYATVEDQALIVGIDPQMKIVSRFKLEASLPTGLVYDGPARRLYVAVRSAVLAINADNGAEVARVPAPRGVESLAFDPAAHLLFAAGGGSVEAMSTTGGLTSLDELLADVKGHTLVYDPSRQLLFLPGGREGGSKMLIVKDIVPGAAQEPGASEASLH